MSPLRFILPVLAATVAVSAQSSCSNSGTTTVENNADATALSSCETFSGSIALATGVAGDVSISRLTKLTGDLVVENNSNIGTLGAPDLEEIGGEFRLNGDTQLGSLNFPQLTKAKSIMWVSLASLGSISFGSELTEATNVEIRDTQLNTLKGINVEVVDTLIIAQNSFLKDIAIKVTNVSTALTVQDNSAETSAQFGNLLSAANISITGAQMIDLSSLVEVEGGMGFLQGSFESLSLPNLTSVSSLSFSNNTKLTNVSFPLLKTVGADISAGDNDELKELIFPKVQTVGAAVDLAGNFTNVTFPVLTKVVGKFNLQSSENITEVCDHFDSLTGSGKPLQGGITCAGSQDDPQNLNGDPTNSSGDDEGAAIKLGMSAFLGLTGLAMFALM